MKKTKIESRGKVGVIVDRPYWMVYVSITARAIHQLGAAIFLATYLLNHPVLQTRQVSLAVAALSGLLLMGVEAFRHRQFLREVFGLVTVLKVFFIGLAFHAWLAPVPTLFLVFFVASLASHAPRGIRHRMLI